MCSITSSKLLYVVVLVVVLTSMTPKMLAFTAAPHITSSFMRSMRMRPSLLTKPSSMLFAPSPLLTTACFSSSSSTPPPPSSPPSIFLSHSEQELFDTLLNVVRHGEAQTTTLRVAGGWVRDKLLSEKARQRREARKNDNVDEEKVVKVDGSDNNVNVPFTADGKFSIAGSFDMPLTRLTQKRKPPPPTDDGTQDNDKQPVDIDIALSNMLGREFA